MSQQVKTCTSSEFQPSRNNRVRRTVRCVVTVEARSPAHATAEHLPLTATGQPSVGKVDDSD